MGATGWACARSACSAVSRVVQREKTELSCRSARTSALLLVRAFGNMQIPAKCPGFLASLTDFHRKKASRSRISPDSGTQTGYSLGWLEGSPASAPYHPHTSPAGPGSGDGSGGTSGKVPYPPTNPTLPAASHRAAGIISSMTRVMILYQYSGARPPVCHHLHPVATTSSRLGTTTMNWPPYPLAK